MKKARHLDAKRLGHARHVVAQQVHHHHVLSALFGRTAQGLGQGGVFFGAVAAPGRALHGPGQQVAVSPVKKQLRRHRQQLPVRARVDIGRITAGLGALQRGKQGQRATLLRSAVLQGQRALHLRGEVDLVQLALANGLQECVHGGVKFGAGQQRLPIYAHLGGGRRAGAGGGRRRGFGGKRKWCIGARRELGIGARRRERLGGPGQSLVVDGKPGQRPLRIAGRMHGQSGVKGGRGFISHIAHAPAPGQ